MALGGDGAGRWSTGGEGCLRFSSANVTALMGAGFYSEHRHGITAQLFSSSSVEETAAAMARSLLFFSCPSA